MDLKDKAKADLLAYKKILDKALEKYFNDFVSDLKSPFTNRNVQMVVNTMISFITGGGKRIRGSLVKYAYKAVAARESDAVLSLSMVIEMIHAYLLMCDDIMDQDEKRHGLPTAHKMLEDYYGREYTKIDKKHIGISFTMMSFTLINHIAFAVILGLKIPENIKSAILKHLHETIRLTVYGQVLDVSTEFEEAIMPKDVIDVHRSKTAYYTFRNPIMAGAILAGASSEQKKALNNYAMNVGIAFQLRDDILGMYGDEEKIGKPVTSDVREGKKTMLIVKALEFGDKKTKEFINKKLGDPKVSIKDLEEFRRIVKETSSLDYSHKLIQEYIAKGKQYLIDNKDLFKKPGYEFLLGIADYIGSREE